MIKLIDETMWKEDLRYLQEFSATQPHKLSQGDYVREFEIKFAEYIGSKYAVFVNSGSSANLLAVYALKEMKLLKNNTVIVPALSWGTTVSPWMQYDFNVILCDTDKNNLGMDIDHLVRLMEAHNPAVVMPVHVIGMPCYVEAIIGLCQQYGSILIEDTCEALGSSVHGQKCGTFGTIGTFSTFVGHHLSTIEGGLIVTNDDKINTMVRMLRAHGWNRDIPATPEYQHIDKFTDAYTFYVPGFNLRNQELNAYLGIQRLEHMKRDAFMRGNLFAYYQQKIIGKYWKPAPEGFVSAFSYPVIHFSRRAIVQELQDNEIECRPLIAGSMEWQPMIVNKYGFHNECHFATNVHKYGFYVPLHCNMDYDDIDKIAVILNKEREHDKEITEMR